jgi:hypothetical protein
MPPALALAIYKLLYFSPPAQIKHVRTQMICNVTKPCSHKVFDAATKGHIESVLALESRKTTTMHQRGKNWYSPIQLYKQGFLHALIKIMIDPNQSSNNNKNVI